MPSSRSPTTPRTRLAKAKELASHIGFATGNTGATSDAPKNHAARPSLYMQDGSTDGRRPSIQFNTGISEARLQSASNPAPRAANAPKLSRRMSSPPPPSTYQRGVSFDTFDNRDATDFSLTLNYKHKHYQHTRRSRTFLCGTDQKDYSEFALEWLIEELVDDGDEIVCLRVVEKDSKIASDASVEQGKYHDEAQKLLDQVIAKNSQDEKSISLVMELAMGKVQDIIQRMIQIYEPAVLIVGTRGRSLGGMQGLLPGSVSKYCLQQSPIPVIVVRPSTKRMKKKKKRQADPARKDYNHILELSGHVLDNQRSIVGPLPSSTDNEADAVARAIGIPTAYQKSDDGASLSRVTSAKSDMTSGPESESPTEKLSPDSPVVILKSPTLHSLDSPQLSEASEDEDNERRGKFENQAGHATGALVDDDVESQIQGERPVEVKAEPKENQQRTEGEG